MMYAQLKCMIKFDLSNPEGQPLHIQLYMYCCRTLIMITCGQSHNILRLSYPVDLTRSELERLVQ